MERWQLHTLSVASYEPAKGISRGMVHHARHKADNLVYESIDHKLPDVFHLPKEMRKENVDVLGDKPVKNDAGEMSLIQEAKQNAWLKIMKGFSTSSLIGTLNTCQTNHR